MQESKILPFDSVENRFARLKVCELSDAEQASLIQLAIDTLAQQHRPGQKLESPGATRDYLQLLLAARKNEVFGALFLDARQRLLGNEELFQGSLNGAYIYPRVVVQKALEYNAGATILYHNHPSGLPEPSRADETITRQLKDALQLIGVCVIDHIVVGTEGSVSFAERGLL